MRFAGTVAPSVRMDAGARFQYSALSLPPTPPRGPAAAALAGISAAESDMLERHSTEKKTARVLGNDMTLRIGSPLEFVWMPLVYVNRTLCVNIIVVNRKRNSARAAYQ